MVRLGDKLPDVAVLDPDGERVSLQRAVHGPTLLMFLRHLT